MAQADVIGKKEGLNETETPRVDGMTEVTMAHDSHECY